MSCWDRAAVWLAFGGSSTWDTLTTHYNSNSHLDYLSPREQFLRGRLESCLNSITIFFWHNKHNLLNRLKSLMNLQCFKVIILTPVRVLQTVNCRRSDRCCIDQRNYRGVCFLTKSLIYVSFILIWLLLLKMTDSPKKHQNTNH